MTLCFGFVLFLLPQHSTASPTADIKFTLEASELLDESFQYVLTELPKHAPVTVLAVQDDWLKVQFKTQVGYIKSDQLTILPPQYMLVQAKSAPLVHVTDLQQIEGRGKLHLNSIVEVYPTDSKNFVFVRYGHLAGYVNKHLLVQPKVKLMTVKDPKGVVVRSTASPSGPVIGQLPAKSDVKMLTTLVGWAFVTTDKLSGYVLASSLVPAKEKPAATKPTSSTKVKKIALTFDDGPHAKVTPQILKILEKYDAKATFFVVGNEVKKNPKVLQAVADAGHEIGNHTFNHAKLTTLSARKIKLQIDSTDAAIKAVIGQNATVFRPPYGALNKTVSNQLKVPSVLWTIDTLDWKHRDPKQTLASVQKNAKNGSIVLLHDIHQTTADALEPILALLEKQGYEFVTVSEILKK